MSMDARRICTAFLAVALTWTGAAFGAGARTANFIVSTPSPQFSQQIAQLAEKYRRDLAIEWLGHELPQWRQPCPVTVQVGRHMGAGGATSFSFDQQGPYDWRMSIQGPPDRLLDSVLPHEVLHTIFATHFGCPLPRWADEGACTTIEHPSEIAKYHDSLIQALTSGRGIPFNRLFAMKEYPADILPLYAQGHSLARFLIAHGGKRRYVAYVGDGMRWNNWTAATKKHYGFESLSELQVTWNEWVAQGCPSVTPRQSPSLEPLPESAQEQLVTNTDGTAGEATASLAVARAKAGAPSDGWYSRKRQRALNTRQLQPITQGVGPQPPAAPPARSIADIASLPGDSMLGRPQQPQPPRQIVVDPGQGGPRGYSVPATVYPQTMPAPGPIPMTMPGAPVPMTMPGAPMPMTMPAAPMPMTVPTRPPAGNALAPSVVYPISNAVPMAASPYMAAPCFGSS
jgi:hypothetical protein